MTDFVLDASALLELVAGDVADPELRRAALTRQGAAPELIDLEVASTLRRLVRSGLLAEADGAAALADARDTPITCTGHRPLLDRVWELRNSISAYDAAYLALAEVLRVPLLTCDARLGRTQGHGAEVVVYPNS